MGKLNAGIDMVKPGQTVKLGKCSLDGKSNFFFNLENG